MWISLAGSWQRPISSTVAWNPGGLHFGKFRAVAGLARSEIVNSVNGSGQRAARDVRSARKHIRN